MKREFLEGLSLDKEIIDKIMSEYGKSTEKLKTEAETNSKVTQELKEQLENANKQIQAFKEMDIEGIKKAADEWKEKAETAEREMKEKLSAAEYDSAVKDYFSKINCSSEFAKAGLMSAFKEKDFKLEEGKFLGADDWLKEMREKDAGSFLQENTNDTGVKVITGAAHKADSEPLSGVEEAFYNINPNLKK